MNKNIDYWNKIVVQPKPIYSELFEQEARYLADHIAAGSSVLDIGCGDGRIIEYILPVADDVTGLDIDPKAIEVTKKKFANKSNVKLIEGDIFNLPFPDESFDVITLMLTLVNLDNRKVEAVNEMKRVMKDEGKIIISVYSEDAWDNRLEQYKAISLPIKEIFGTKVVLDQFAEGSTSEQLSFADLRQLATESDLIIQNIKKVPTIAYILELVHPK